MYRFYTKAIVVLFLSFLIFPIFTSAQPSGFSNQLYMGNWNQVVGFTFDANGRMFAWEKSGKVWIVQNNTKTLMIDISEEVGDWRDFGLVGFTLDPNFLTNGYVYLFYVVDRHHLLNYGTTQYSATTNEYFNATIGRITRYTATSASNFAQVNYTSRKVLVGETKSTGMPILHESHGVGQLIFGTDGTLIASMGDGASYSSTDQGSAIETYYAQAISDGIITAAQNIGAYRSQSLDSYNGKLLRIDPATGNGLSTNPYYNSAAPQSPRSRIWASGLRNPYRITLRPGTGSTNPAAGNPGVIYIGDVGWGTREELDICTTAGQNFGWPKYEGMTYQPGYNNNTYLPTSHQLPKADWRSDNQPRASIGNTIYNIGSTQVPGPTFNGNSSTGGVWYTKTDFPASFRGYYHADYGGQWIRYFNMNASNEVVSVANFVDAAGACVFVGASPTQSGIFYVSYPSEIRRVISTANTNLPPIANATATPTYGTSPLTVQFTNTSSDPEGGALTYLWNFGDGTTTSTATNPSHIFTTAGTYNVTLTVTDNTGQTAIKNLSISVNNTPPNIAALSIDNVNSYPATAGAILQLSATVSDAQSPNSQLSYAWQITFYHDTHTHPEPIVYGQTTTGVLSYTPCNDGSTYYYRISLTVTDPGGLSATRYKNIYPDCNNAGNLPCYVGANGSLLREVWNNISGNATTNLTTNSAYPNSPTSTNQITTFQVPINIIDNYGTRIRGFIKPSVSGNYQFNISGDDNCDLYFATAGVDTVNKSKIAFVPEWTNPLEFTKYPSQTSAVISLDANKLYYIEALHKEGSGGDNLAVAWKTPTNSTWTVIPSANLVSYQRCGGTSLQNQTITFNAIPNKLTTDAPFAVSATASSGLPVTYSIVSGPATISGNTITLTGQVGTVTVRASQAGNSQYAAATPVDRSFTVTATTPCYVGANGSLLREVWNNISGNATTNLTTNSAYPNSPTSTNQITTFQVPINIIDNYGTRIRGFIKPSVSGNYQFNISGDDNCDLYFATAGVDTVNKSKIAFVPEWTNPLEFTKYPSQTSAVISLDANKLYYIEALHKEGSGGDNLAVAWKTPTNSTWTVIPSANLVSYQRCGGTSLQNQTITFNAIPNKLTTDAPFAVSATASSGLPVTYSIVSGPATISGNTITLTGQVGTVTVRASQAGNSQYAAATPVDRSFTVTTPTTTTAPDLVLSNLVSPTSGVQGNIVAYTFTLNNIGNALASGNYIIGAYLSTDNTWSTNDIQVGIVNTGNTPVGYNAVVTGAITVPATQATGNYYLILRADKDNVIAESNENNNNSNAVAFQVTASTGGNGTDLQLTINVSPANPGQWQNATFTVTLWNKGTVAATNATVKFPIVSGLAYQSNATAKGSYDSWGSIWTVGTMAANETATLTVNLFTLQTTIPTFMVQVQTASPTDVDSTPGNNTSTTPTEDDEATIGNNTAGSRQSSIAFSAYKVHNGVVLDWANNMSEVIASYSIEQSADNRQYRIIATVSDDYNDATIHAFNEIDYNPTIGENYYRIKYILEDGNYFYSPIQKVFVEEVVDFTLYPNPNYGNEAYLQLRKFEGKSCTILVSDLDGKVLQTTEIDAINEVTTIDISNLKDGGYTVFVKIDGGATFTQRLIVVRFD